MDLSEETKKAIEEYEIDIKNKRFDKIHSFEEVKAELELSG
jgi:hypothetical protein